MSLDKCPKCDGTNITEDRKRIREILSPLASNFIVMPSFDEATAICPDCNTIFKLFSLALPSKERIVEMCRRTITDYDDDYHLEKNA